MIGMRPAAVFVLGSLASLGCGAETPRDDAAPACTVDAQTWDAEIEFDALQDAVGDAQEAVDGQGPDTVDAATSDASSASDAPGPAVPCNPMQCPPATSCCDRDTGTCRPAGDPACDLP